MSEAEGSPPPHPEAAGPPVSTVEHALGVTLVLGGLILVGLKLQPAATTAAPRGDESLAKLSALWSAGGARGIAAALVVFGLASLACAVVFLPRGVRALRGVLRRRALGPPTLALALVLYGVGIVLQGMALSGYRAPAVALGDRPPVAVPRDGKPLEVLVRDGAVSLRAPTDAPAPEAARVRATLRWGEGSGRLQVASGAEPAVRVEGELVEPETAAEVWPGDRLQVGDLEGRVVGSGWSERLARSSGGSLAALLGVLLLIQGLELMRRRDPSPPPPLDTGGVSLLTRVGVVREGLGREVLRGVAGYLAFFPIYLGLVLLTQVLARALHLPIESHSLVRALERDPSLAALVVIQAVALAPLLEELLYRGISLPAFERCFGAGGAVLATALLFGVVHAGFGSLLPMFGLGVLFASLRLLSPSGSLAAPITAHACHNGLTLALVLAIQASGP